MKDEFVFKSEDSIIEHVKRGVSQNAISEVIGVGKSAVSQMITKIKSKRSKKRVFIVNEGAYTVTYYVTEQNRTKKTLE